MSSILLFGAVGEIRPPVAASDLGCARSGTRGKHSAEVTVPLRSSYELLRADDKKTPQGRRCVYYQCGLEEETKEKKEEGEEEGGRECAWCMLDRSHLKTLWKRTNHPKKEARCDYPQKHTGTKHLGLAVLNYNRHFRVPPHLRYTIY